MRYICSKLLISISRYDTPIQYLQTGMRWNETTHFGLYLDNLVKAQAGIQGDCPEIRPRKTQ